MMMRLMEKKDGGSKPRSSSLTRRGILQPAGGRLNRSSLKLVLA